MANRKVSLKVASPIEVGNVDVQFAISDGHGLIGTVTVSKGGIDWRGRGKQSKQSASWDRFAELMTDGVTPKTTTRGPRTPRNAALASGVEPARVEPVAPAKRRARKTGAPAATTAPTVETSAAPTTEVIRAWAKNAGIPVKSKGKLAQSVFDAFSAAHR